MDPQKMYHDDMQKDAPFSSSTARTAIPVKLEKLEKSNTHDSFLSTDSLLTVDSFCENDASPIIAPRAVHIPVEEEDDDEDEDEWTRAPSLHERWADAEPPASPTGTLTPPPTETLTADVAPPTGTLTPPPTGTLTADVAPPTGTLIPPTGTLIPPTGTLTPPATGTLTPPRVPSSVPIPLTPKKTPQVRKKRSSLPMWMLGNQYIAPLANNNKKAKTTTTE